MSFHLLDLAASLSRPSTPAHHSGPELIQTCRSEQPFPSPWTQSPSCSCTPYCLRRLSSLQERRPPTPSSGGILPSPPGDGHAMLVCAEGFRADLSPAQSLGRLVCLLYRSTDWWTEDKAFHRHCTARFTHEPFGARSLWLQGFRSWCAGP